MSKQGGLGTTVRITFLILMGALVLFLGIIFLIVFVPVVGWYLWQLLDENRALKARLAALEGPKKPD